MSNRRATRRARCRAAVTMARTAVCVVAALVAAGCSSDGDDAAGGGATTTADVTTTTALTGVLTPVADVLAGQCLDELPDPEQQAFAVLVIPCEESHTYEVYAQADIDMGTPTPANAPYPGGAAVANAAEAQCFTAFDEFMGVTWEQSAYDIQTWWPTQPSWTQEKDRKILCAVYRVTGGRTKGSVRGSAE